MQTDETTTRKEIRIGQKFPLQFYLVLVKRLKSDQSRENCCIIWSHNRQEEKNYDVASLNASYMNNNAPVRAFTEISPKKSLMHKSLLFLGRKNWSNAKYADLQLV